MGQEGVNIYVISIYSACHEAAMSTLQKWLDERATFGTSVQGSIPIHDRSKVLLGDAVRPPFLHSCLLPKVSYRSMQADAALHRRAQNEDGLRRGRGRRQLRRSLFQAAHMEPFPTGGTITLDISVRVVGVVRAAAVDAAERNVLKQRGRRSERRP
jgi:hypothetical protein